MLAQGLKLEEAAQRIAIPQGRWRTGWVPCRQTRYRSGRTSWYALQSDIGDIAHRRFCIVSSEISEGSPPISNDTDSILFFITAVLALLAAPPDLAFGPQAHLARFDDFGMVLRRAAGYQQPRQGQNDADAESVTLATSGTLSLHQKSVNVFRDVSVR